MFDFIKRVFHGQAKSSKPQDVAGLDVVEGNDIEILKTSDYSEGTPADAIERYVAELELPPPEVDLPMLGADLPAAELDEPSDEPDMMLRQVELQRLGMTIEQLNLQKYVDLSLKGKMISEYVSRSKKLIRNQDENGVIPIWKDDCSIADGSEMCDSEHAHRRDLFNAHEPLPQKESTLRQEVQMTNRYEKPNDDLTKEIDELLRRFAEVFAVTEKEESQESYARWLLSLAEEGTASPEILWLLVAEPNPDVRFCLAENYHIGEVMLKILSEDENPYVAHRAQKTLMRLHSAAGKVVDREFGNGEINRFRKSG